MLAEALHDAATRQHRLRPRRNPHPWRHTGSDLRGAPEPQRWCPRYSESRDPDAQAGAKRPLLPITYASPVTSPRATTVMVAKIADMRALHEARSSCRIN